MRTHTITLKLIKLLEVILPLKMSCIGIVSTIVRDFMLDYSTLFVIHALWRCNQILSPLLIIKNKTLKHTYQGNIFK